MEQVFQYVDQMFEQYVKEVATLCSFRSVKGDSAGLQACRNLLKIKLDALGFCPGEYGGMQEAALLHGYRGVAGKKTLLFYNHYDVVPEGPSSAWTTSPFEIVSENGRLWGRGISDNNCLLYTSPSPRD